MKEKKWYANGIQFECQGSGKCCLSRGEYGYVYLTLEDRKRFAAYFKMPTKQWTKDFCEKVDGYYRIKHSRTDIECRFLENNRCSVYEARPTQCRTWPFWPEVMSAKNWALEVKAECPGVGKGKTYSFEEIEKILQTQKRSEDLL